MNLDVERHALVAALTRARPPPAKFDLKAYLGSPYPVLGLSVPQIQAIVSAFRKEHRDLAIGDLNRLADRLWPGETFEEKALAISLLGGYRAILDDTTWSLVDRWVEGVSGWGLCDALGMGPIAAMVYDRPARFRAVLGWTRSKKPWRRRVAAYALRDFVRAGELDKPLQLLERLLTDDEFWVRRAVGTWLRESWKKDRRRTEAFLRTHVRGLPAVVVTIATERAPKSFREELRRKSGVNRAARRSRAGPRVRSRRRRA